MTSEFISLDHGSGGKIAHRLTADLLLPLFDNPILSDMHDGAVLALNDHTRVAFSTDTFTVTPLFFPGGDIGELAVNGTINDVAMCGATPLFISLALIIAEGSPATLSRRDLPSGPDETVSGGQTDDHADLRGLHPGHSADIGG